MIDALIHPATVQLLRLQSRGRRRRMWRRFCQPRRLVLSAIACVLAVVWLGNAALTVWLRETASPGTLRALLSLGLLLCATWHFAKAAFFRPDTPFDWTPAERDILVGMPLRPRDLVAYQVASVTVTTILKGALFTLLLFPDLHCVPLGLIGVLLAMMALEMLRMGIEIAAWGMGRAAFVAYRAVVVAGLVAGGFAVGAVVLHETVVGGRLDIGGGLLRNSVGILVQLNDSALGYAALPFRPFVELILAEGMTPANVGLAVAALVAVTGMTVGVILLYGVTSGRVAQREKRDYRAASSAPALFEASIHCDLRPALAAGFGLRLRQIPRWGGAGPLAWRQLLGARRYWGSLLTAMIAPSVLASAPCFVIADPNIALLSTAGTLAFYTFLLLPTALRFDFRRDLDRLATLKGLPISPAAAVIGQTLAPVLIATAFQCGVLAITVAARSLPPHHLLLAMLVMAPLNVLVFSLDNLIFLLYPYRLQQEGLEIFFRTMLTFTGKGLLFAISMVVVSAWGFAAAAVTRGIAGLTSGAITGYMMFTAGMIVGSSILATLVLYGLCRTYRNLNPVEDVPR